MFRSWGFGTDAGWNVYFAVGSWQNFTAISHISVTQDSNVPAGDVTDDGGLLSTEK